MSEKLNRNILKVKFVHKIGHSKSGIRIADPLPPSFPQGIMYGSQ